MPMRARTSFIPTLAGIVFAAQTLVAVDVKVHADKTFDFTRARTWAWNPDGPGDVRMARTPDDEPAAMRQEAEPVIMAAVEVEMGRRGLEPAAAMPDLLFTYYLLLTAGASAQSMGQFIPATPQWGLPPFAPATQSLTMMNQGALVLDASAKQGIVWRGVARARIDFGADAERRHGLIREAVRDLLRRFPAKR